MLNLTWYNVHCIRVLCVYAIQCKMHEIIASFVVTIMGLFTKNITKDWGATIVDHCLKMHYIYYLPRATSLLPSSPCVDELYCQIASSHSNNYPALFKHYAV